MDNQHNYTIRVDENTRIIDEGNGRLMFSKPVTVTDGSEQWNNTKYDIPSMDIESFNNKLTIDHGRSVRDIVGKVIGLKKVGNKRVTIDGVDFAVQESDVALFTYNMTKGGYVTDYSIETIGPWPDEEGLYKESKLVGLSAVLDGNNKSAKINEIALNSYNQAKENGLKTTYLESNFRESIDKKENVSDTNNEMKFVTLKNSRTFDVEVTYKNAAGDEVTYTLTPNATVDVSEDQKDAVQNQINDAVAPKTEEKEEGKPSDNSLEDLKKEFNDLKEDYKKLEKKSFDNSAKEPKFEKQTNSNKSTNIKDMNVREQNKILLEAGFRDAPAETVALAKSINEMRVEGHIEAGRAENTMTMADFDNFVVPTEQYREIVGYRPRFDAILSEVSYQETLSLEFAWLTRNGDINMQEVEFCDDGEDGNLKPISEYGADIKTAQMHELAAVALICTSATRHLAVDLMNDVQRGYLTDYDRKKAQLVIGLLQLAVNETGNQFPYDSSTGANALTSWIETAAAVSEVVDDGKWIMSNATRWEIIKQAIRAKISGDFKQVLMTGNLEPLFGSNYVITPNELLPTLGKGQTRTFVIGGNSVVVDTPIFFTDLTNFVGRTSGGLSYDISDTAAYEVGTGESREVRSAFQRNELVARGSFKRNGAILDPNKVAGLTDNPIS